MRRLRLPSAAPTCQLCGTLPRQTSTAAPSATGPRYVHRLRAPSSMWCLAELALLFVKMHVPPSLWEQHWLRQTLHTLTQLVTLTFLTTSTCGIGGHCAGLIQICI